MGHVLVTGGGGYLGSVLCLKLLELGYRVSVLDRLDFGGQSLLHVLPHPDFRLVTGDIRDRGAVERALLGADMVVHLAAVVGDPACAADPERALAVNREGSLALLAASEAAGIRRFVFASTCSNYGKMEDTSLLASEEHPLRPVSLYAETKVVVEQALLSGRYAALCPVVLRFATLYGLSPRMRFDLTVNQFAAEMQGQGEITVFGEQFWRPYVHVHDAARAIAACLGAGAATVAGRVFNVGDTGQNFRKSDIVELIQQRLRRPAKVNRVEKAEDPRDYRVSFDRIASDLPFATTRTVEEGIDEVIFSLEAGVFASPRPGAGAAP